MYLSYQTKAGYEKNDLYFIKFLKNHLNIQFFAVSDSGRSGFYTYKERYKNDKEFLSIDTFWLNSRWEIYYQILKFDIIIISSLHGAENFAKFCKKLNKKVIVIDSFFNQDYNTDIPADLFIFKGNYALKTYLNLSKKNNIKAKICGCIQSIYFEKNILSITKFKKKYKLKHKKTCVLFPHGPQYNIKKFYRDTLLKIIKIIKKNKFNLLVNLHPTFFNSKKKNLYKNYQLDRILYKHKIELGDFNNSIINSNISVAIASNVFQQVNILDRPIIFVNRQNFLVNGKNLVSEDKLKKIKYYNFSVHKKILAENKKPRIVNTQKLKDHMKFYGVDTNLKNLNYYLKNITKLNKLSKVNNKLKSNISKYVGNKCYISTSKEIKNFINKQKINKGNKVKIFFYKVAIGIIAKIYLTKVNYF